MSHTAPKLTRWTIEHLKDQLPDISQHGATAGWPHITYTADCVELYDRFEDEIYAILNEYAESCGYKNPEEVILQSNPDFLSMLETPEGRKNLLLWFAIESIAFDHVEHSA